MNKFKYYIGNRHHEIGRYKKKYLLPPLTARKNEMNNLIVNHTLYL